MDHGSVLFLLGAGLIWLQLLNTAQVRSSLFRGIAGHSSTCDENSLYIFGGVRGNNCEAITKFFSINFAASRANNDRTKNGEESMNKTRFSKKFSFFPDEDIRSWLVLI